MSDTDLSAFLSRRPPGTQLEWTHEGRRLRGEIYSAVVLDGGVVSVEFDWIAEAAAAGWHKLPGARGKLTLISLSGPTVEPDGRAPDRMVFHDVTGPIFFDLPGTSEFVNDGEFK